MSRALATLACVLALQGCRTGADGNERTTETEPDVDGSSSSASTGASESSGAVEPVCNIGETRPCECSDGSEGREVCIELTGRYSQCGCSVDPDVYDPELPPAPTYCGELECAAMVEETTEAGAKPCCTSQDECGATSSFVFGAACVARGGDPGDLANSTCPDEFPIFMDLEGCCRPDGACGLSVDHVNNWDVGCIERTVITQLLNDGNADRQSLADFFLLGSVDVDFLAISCR